MAVKIRMMRIGRRHRPYFRINAIESRNQQKGRVLEKLGHYDPIEKDKDKQVVINVERIKHWLDVGAVPTDAVSQILLRCGIKTKHAEEKTKRRERARERARATGKLFTKAERAAAAKAETAEPDQSTQPAETTAPPKADKAKVAPPETTGSDKADEGDKAEAESGEPTESAKTDDTKETDQAGESKDQAVDIAESDKAGEDDKMDVES